jgi:hypothetical protein
MESLVEAAQQSGYPHTLEERLDATQERTRRPGEEHEPEEEGAEHEDSLEPEVRAHVVRADRQQEADRAEEHRRSPAQASLEEHRPGDHRGAPRMPAPGLDNPDRVAAERRRKDLAGRVGDEVRPREPGQALVDAVRLEQPSPSPGEAGDRDHHDRDRQREPRDVRVREDVERRSEVDLPDEVGDRRGGQDERPDLPRPTRHAPLAPRASRGDGTTAPC